MFCLIKLNSFSKINFYWSIVALQCCVSFYCTAKLISYMHTYIWGSAGKESACSAGDLGSIPGLGRSPGGGHGNPVHYSGPENPHRQRFTSGLDSAQFEQKEVCKTDRSDRNTGAVIGINHRYFLESVSEMDDEIKITMINPDSPIFVNNLCNMRCTQVVMPIMVRCV